MFKSLFNKEKPGKENKIAMTEDYPKWRQVIFSVQPNQVGISSQEKDKVYGLLMDFGMVDRVSGAHFVLSTTAFPTGEASFRPTVGGGFVGLGNDAKVASTAKDLNILAQKLLEQTKLTNDTSLPAPGYARFYFLTTSGIRVYEAHINELQKQEHPFFEVLRGFSYIRQFAEKLIDQQRAQKK